MPTAPFARDLALSSERAKVWDTITDVTRLVGWVTILHDAAEVRHLDRYTATLQDRLGPFKLRAELGIDVSDVEEGRRIVVHAEGEDRQVSSRIAVDGQVDLTELSGGGTELHVDGTYEVTGRVATLGASMIHNKANKILEEFFTRVSEELG